jgi:hypothetical protein
MTSTSNQHVHCLRCGRRLYATSSVRAKYGRWCAAKIRTAALAEVLASFTAAQVEKARELISDGGLVPTSRPGVFRAVSSDGTTSYLTHSQACNCPRFLRAGKPCYHSAGVRMVMASVRPA